MERNPVVPASTKDEVIFIHVAKREESQGALCNAKGDMTSLRKHEGVPQVTHNSRGTLSFPPQHDENYEILPCTHEEALLCCSVSIESPHFHWN